MLKIPKFISVCNNYLYMHNQVNCVEKAPKNFQSDIFSPSFNCTRRTKCLCLSINTFAYYDFVVRQYTYTYNYILTCKL